MRKASQVITIGVLLACMATPASSQTSIIKGEISTGVYENVKTDGAGRLQVTPGGSGTSTVTIAPAQSITATGVGYTSQITLTRSADTVPYTAGDVIGSTTAAGGAVLTFANIGTANGHILITDYDLLIERSTIPAGMTSYRLHLYSVSPPSNLGDNAVWDLASTDWSSYLGYLDLGNPVDVGSSLFTQVQGSYKKLQMGMTTSLFGYLVTNGGYTPAASTVKLIRLNAVGVQ